MKIPKLKVNNQYRLKNYNFILALTVVALSILGILFVGSAKESLQSRQVFGVVVGIIFMVVVSLIDYTWILSFSWPIYAISIGSLLAVLVIGTSVNGAKRWINLGFTTFQPSELTKILLILFFSKFIMDHK